jgi:zinc transport system permease protein
MLVIPVATATAVTGFKRALVAGVAAGQFATLTGVTLSYLYDVAAGGTVVLVAIAGYLAVAVAVRIRRRVVGRRR